ncbi:bacteriophage spanin2 family protein [Leisingera sp. D0M16]|uniref:bacteriophage spanin2 family protein n=1 Tax=Leisingera coralii TaxID=3351347 RepID=UPI003B7BB2D1
MMRLLPGLCLCLALAACGSLAGKLAGAIGGSPNLAANVQAGRTNAQTVGQAVFSDQRIIRPQARSIEQSEGRTSVRSESVQTIVVQEDPPPWLLLVALAGWLLPTPSQIGSAASSGFRRMLSRVLPKGEHHVGMRMRRKSFVRGAGG